LTPAAQDTKIAVFPLAGTLWEIELMAHGITLTLRKIRGTHVVGSISPFSWTEGIWRKTDQKARPSDSYRWARRREYLKGMKQGKKDWKNAQRAKAGVSVGREAVSGSAPASA
jgi:hypothetical protein